MALNSMNIIDLYGNFSQIKKDDFCQLAFSFRKNYKILVFVSIQVVLSLLTLILLRLVYNSREMQKIWALISRDLKIIVFAGFVSYLVFAVNAFLSIGFKLLVLVAPFQPCDFIWSGTTCYYLQLVYTGICPAIYAWVHVGLFFERLAASLSSKRDGCNGIFGGCLTFVMVVISPLPLLILSEAKTYTTDRFYCAGTTNIPDSKLLSTLYFAVGLEILITIGDLFLFLFNRRQIKKHKKRLHSLEHSFKLRAMKLSMRLIFPYSILHTIVYSIQMFAHVFYADQIQYLNIEDGMMHFEFTNFCRVFGTFSLILFLWIFNKLQARSNVLWAENVDEANAHFKEFQRIIS